MVIRIEKGDRLIVTRQPADNLEMAFHVLEVTHTVEDNEMRSAVVDILVRDGQPQQERVRLVITFAAHSAMEA